MMNNFHHESCDILPYIRILGSLVVYPASATFLDFSIHSYRFKMEVQILPVLEET